MALQKPYYPACVIAILIVLSFGLFNICQLYLLKDSYPVSKLPIGSDYISIYTATQNLIRGISPYENRWYSYSPMPDYLNDLFVFFNINKGSSWYCYPPILAYLNYPSMYLDIDTALRLMFFLLIIAVLGAYALINSSFESIGGRDKKIIFLCGIIIIAFSHPFYFLIARGHMIGLVFLFLAMGLYLFKKNNSLSSVFFALAIGMIIYPVLLLVPLLLFRRYKIIVLTILSLALLVLFCPHLWLEFFKKHLFDRFQEAGYMVLEDNCSLATTCSFLLIFLNKLFSIIGLEKFRVLYSNVAALGIYAFILCTMALADMKIQKKHSPLEPDVELSLMMMYFPFMIAIPKNSFHYNLVLLILLVPALCALIQKLKKPMPGIILWTFMVGIFLSQMQVRFIQNLIDLDFQFFYFFPAFGLFLVMIGCVLFKLWFLMAFQKTGNSIGK